MSAPGMILALDCSVDQVRAVTVRADSARPEVCDAEEFAAGSPIPEGFFDRGAVAVSLPDDRVIAKFIALPNGTADPIERARFELFTSLTGAENDYLSDIIPTGITNLYLALAVRPQLIHETPLPAWCAQAGLSPFYTAPRSVALAQGYLSYCTPAAAGLVILVDLDPGSASVALVFNRRLVAVARLPLAGVDLSEPAGRETCAVELKTLISLRLATLFSHGLTLPPAALVVAGNPVDDYLLADFHRFFSMPVTTPAVNTGFLRDHLRLDPVRLRRFLVPLGLTANSLAQ